MDKKSVCIFTCVILGLTSLVLFQNCSNTRFVSEDSSSLSSDQAPAGGVEQPTGVDPTNSQGSELGLQGGHFDLDTSSQVYAFNAGKTDHHVHEYDDKYNVTEVDFFNLLDSKFTKISDRVNSSQSFYIVVANAQWSPGAILEINGVNVSAVSHQSAVNQYMAGNTGALQKYSLSNLQSLKLKFSSNDLGQGILVPTQTSCVVGNKPSARNEYRNGALVIQIIEASQMGLSPSTGTALSNGGLLWEASIFWHKDGAPCQ